MKLKTGKDEIQYLLARVFENYETETGETIIRNTNRKNYKGIARKLSDISNALPQTAEKYGHDIYPPDYNPRQLEYPSRKYDITASQVKDAYMGLVSSPRNFLIDACYIYLYEMGRKGFEKNPVDENLLRNSEMTPEAELNFYKLEHENLKKQITALHDEKEGQQKNLMSSLGKKKRIVAAVLVLMIAALIFSLFRWMAVSNEWKAVKKDMNILSYKPTQAEVDSLEGVWLCYTGSPQARISDPNRFHMVVANVVDIKYKSGYFVFNRYGANFDHAGYMQFEAPWLVSIHSYVKNKKDSIESPRHSLMRLDKERPFVPVISASWSFDVGDKNNIIGIREVYIKLGKGGSMEEVINTIENASCRCKIVKWQLKGETKTFYLKNELLDSLPHENLKSLINEKSILLRVPQEGLIISKDTVGNKK
jgi:hypothetical protein